MPKLLGDLGLLRLNGGEDDSVRGGEGGDVCDMLRVLVGEGGAEIDGCGALSLELAGEREVLLVLVAEPALEGIVCSSRRRENNASGGEISVEALEIHVLVDDVTLKRGDLGVGGGELSGERLLSGDCLLALLLGSLRTCQHPASRASRKGNVADLLAARKTDLQPALLELKLAVIGPKPLVLLVGPTLSRAGLSRALLELLAGGSGRLLVCSELGVQIGDGDFTVRGNFLGSREFGRQICHRVALVDDKAVLCCYVCLEGLDLG